MFLLLFLASYLAVFLLVCRREFLETTRIRDQLERLEWPPAEAMEFIVLRRRQSDLALQTFRYGTAIAFAACALGSLVA
jgi:hypothetical protein